MHQEVNTDIGYRVNKVKKITIIDTTFEKVCELCIGKVHW